jgi:hypothetical protein
VLYHLDDCWPFKKLRTCGGFVSFILSEFEWKNISIKPLNDNKAPQDDNQTPQGDQSLHLLGELNLEITLTGRLPSYAQKFLEKNTMVNRGCLLDDAFQPRSFTLRIEQGNFSPPGHINDVFTWKKGYTKRLVFDKPPYPPESEWKEDWKEDWTVDKGHNWWDYNEFVSDNPRVKEMVARDNSVRNINNS